MIQGPQILIIGSLPLSIIRTNRSLLCSQKLYLSIGFGWGNLLNFEEELLLLTSFPTPFSNYFCWQVSLKKKHNTHSFWHQVVHFLCLHWNFSLNIVISLHDSLWCTCLYSNKISTHVFVLLDLIFKRIILLFLCWLIVYKEQILVIFFNSLIFFDHLFAYPLVSFQHNFNSLICFHCFLYQIFITSPFGLFGIRCCTLNISH